MSTAIVIGALISAPCARAVPPDFPDVDSRPAVDVADYYVKANYPAFPGWQFRTATGLRCLAALEATLGLACQYDVPGAPGHHVIVSATTLDVGQSRSTTDPYLPDTRYPLLPAGRRIATNNGITCAALTDATLACRVDKPPMWDTGPTDGLGRPYGQHGFVFTSSASPTLF